MIHFCLAAFKMFVLEPSAVWSSFELLGLVNLNISSFGSIFNHYFLKYYFSVLFSVLLGSHGVYAVLCLMVSHKYLRLCSPFFIFSSFCYSDWIILIIHHIHYIPFLIPNLLLNTTTHSHPVNLEIFVIVLFRC